MGFLASRFPDDIARGATGGHPNFRTVIVVTSSGAEQGIAEWSLAKGRWNVSQALKIQRDDGVLVTDTARFELAREFIYMARGRLHRFRFKDWADYTCQRVHGRLTLLTATTYQANKVYGSEPSFEYVRKLTRLVTGKTRVWKAGVALATPGDFTVAVDTGIVTFAIAPGASAVEISTEFDVPARFDTDRLDADLVYRRGNGDSLLRWDDIDIAEVRE